MQDLLSFNDPFYKEALQAEKDMNSTVATMKRQREDVNDIQSYIHDTSTKIMNDYVTGLQAAIAASEEHGDEIEASYKQVAYGDLQQELLRRQDWNQRLDISTPTEIKDLIKQLPQIKPTAYEFNELLKYVRNAPKLQDDAGNLESELMDYKSQSHVGEEWLNDPAYLKEWKHHTDLMNTPQSMLARKTKDGQWEFYWVQEEAQKALEGYNVRLR